MTGCGEGSFRELVDISKIAIKRLLRGILCHSKNSLYTRNQRCHFLRRKNDAPPLPAPHALPRFRGPWGVCRCRDGAQSLWPRRHCTVQCLQRRSAGVVLEVSRGGKRGRERERERERQDTQSPPPPLPIPRPSSPANSTLRRYQRERRNRNDNSNSNGFFSGGSGSSGSSSIYLPSIGDSQYASGGINDFRLFNPSSNTGQFLTTAFLDDTGGQSSLGYTGSSSFYFRR